MTITRRGFLGVTGLSALALAGKTSVDALASVAGEHGKGEGAIRWAMVIDVDKCLGHAECTSCIKACHEVHNVPDFPDRAHEVKWIWKEPFDRAFPEQENDYAEESLMKRPVMVFCNHCDKPPCVRVCPTKATWKREDGVVMMDWHRCIGCRYCVAACPYGSRSFNWVDPRPNIKHLNPDFPTRTKGVVEKCTLCEERLAVGKKPACVEACEEKALIFGDLQDPASEVLELVRKRSTLRRRSELGTDPQIYYLA